VAFHHLQLERRCASKQQAESGARSEKGGRRRGWPPERSGLRLAEGRPLHAFPDFRLLAAARSRAVWHTAHWHRRAARRPKAKRKGRSNGVFGLPLSRPGLPHSTRLAKLGKGCLCLSSDFRPVRRAVAVSSFCGGATKAHCATAVQHDRACYVLLRRSRRRSSSLRARSTAQYVLVLQGAKVK
jgi:hypothetical protein